MEARPEIFQYAVGAMVRGDFSSLQTALGGPEKFDTIVIGWFEKRYFDGYQETLDEIFAAACMLGRVKPANFLLDNGVDPYAGMRTWLAGPHWAVSGGHLDLVRLLLARNIPLEIENRYGGTMLGQALWSARFEHVETHAEIVELLVKRGAHVEAGTLEWWNEQVVPDRDTKTRIVKVLLDHHKFHANLESARELVVKARTAGDATGLADALRGVGNIERRHPPLRESANKAYTEAAKLYLQLARPLDAAWITRHIGINHEYAERLTIAESAYDRALGLYREFSRSDDLDHANAVRYAAVIKNRLGKRFEAETLWSEAVKRYEGLGIVDGICEGRLHLANFALDRGDMAKAHEHLEIASEFAESSTDNGTHKFVAEISDRVKSTK